MDFELISGPGTPARHPLRELEFFFLNRKKQWQMWLAQPPHLLSGIIFGLVALELFLTRLLKTPVPVLTWPGQLFVTAAGLFLVLGAMVMLAGQIGDLFDKKGSPVVTLSLLSVGLAPLLLLLPLSLGFRMIGISESYSLFLLLVLIGAVLSLWREALEASFKFSRFQSAAVLYSAFSLAVALFVFIIYILLLTQLSDLLQGIL